MSVSSRQEIVATYLVFAFSAASSLSETVLVNLSSESYLHYALDSLLVRSLISSVACKNEQGEDGKVLEQLPRAKVDCTAFRDTELDL